MVDPRLSPRDEKALQDMLDRGLLPGHKIENGRLMPSSGQVWSPVSHCRRYGGPTRAGSEVEV